ncbi:hypothetical protein QUF75_00270 [Desulfococcaceae bacterium HSG7]|nr:hypothetical protein [Desulfococcaceae bacterium HSG7]
MRKKLLGNILFSLALAVCCVFTLNTTAAFAETVQERIAKGYSDCTWQRSDNLGDYALDQVLTIPVWVHILTADDGSGNITDEMAQKQVDVLTEDYRAAGGWSGGWDTGIQFRLAGITRYPDSEVFYGQNAGTKGEYQKNRLRYINLWSTNFGIEVGFANVPDATYDPTKLHTMGAGGGTTVRVDYRNFGRNASAGIPNDLGRVATHYIGRTLGLRPTFSGDGSYLYWDNVNFVNVYAPNYGSSYNDPDREIEKPDCYYHGDLLCDTWANQNNDPDLSCPDEDYASWGYPDTVHNYMNYTNGRCKNQFTQEQAQRMRCSIMTYTPLLAGVPVYRFWSDAFKTHLYTIDENEKDTIIATYAEDQYKYEGVAFYVYSEKPLSTQVDTELVPVYRFYSDSLKHHFFTADETEKSFYIQNYADTWTYEGVAWYADSTNQADTTAVYRFYSPLLQSFHYTTDEVERDWIINTFSYDQWRSEGVAYYVNKY